MLIWISLSNNIVCDTNFIPDRLPVFYSDRSQFMITLPNLNYNNDRIKDLLSEDGREQDRGQVGEQDITPLRFRYENGEHELITVNVDEIHARKEMTIGKGGSIIYTCASMIDDTRMLYQLRYEIGSHKWIFMKKLS